jgi:hypothetical protein
MAELQPWIEREKAQHIRRAVRMAKRGFERIERLWDEREAADCKTESLIATTLDKHDAIIRRNLGINDEVVGLLGSRHLANTWQIDGDIVLFGAGPCATGLIRHFAGFHS